LYGTTIQKNLGIQDYYIEITRNDVPKFEVEYNAEYTLAKVTVVNFPENASIKEYSLNGGKKWISCKNGDVITLKENTTIQTRYKMNANDQNYVTGSSKAIVKLNYNIKLEKPTISLTANNQYYNNTTISGYDVLAKFQTPNSDDKTISYETSITKYSLSEIANAGYILENTVNSSQIKNYKSNSDAQYERLEANIAEKKFTEPGVYKIKVRAITHGGFVVSEEQIEIVTVFNKVQYIEDLVDLSTTVNKGYSFKGANLSLTRDLDFTLNASYRNATDTSYGDLNGDGTIQGIKTELTSTNGIGFTPIGLSYSRSSDRTFRGTFDGNGYKIKNIYINSTNEYVGLFGYISGGKIEDLGLVNGKISSTLESESQIEKVYVGGIVGYNSSGTITNCYNTVAVSRIINDTNANNSRAAYVSGSGGIAGYNSSSGTINNCYNTGAVSGTSYNISGESYGVYCGGIAGYTEGTISDCYNTGNITGSSDESAYAGGIVGNCIDLNKIIIISDCYNTGVISASSSKEVNVGGIAGSTYNGSISNCYNTGRVTSGSNTKFAYIGGIVGDNNGPISNCYNTGAISNSGTTQGSDIAGIAGYLYYGTISNCYNTGTISISSTTEGSNSGGVVGEKSTMYGTISKCYYLSGTATGGIDGSDVTGSAEVKTSTYMKSQAFVTLLNSNKNAITDSTVELVNWIYVSGNYPKLDI